MMGRRVQRAAAIATMMLLLYDGFSFFEQNGRAFKDKEKKAACGDDIAQSTNHEDYDRHRAAVSFGLFEYHALHQHVLFPVIVTQCHGQYARALLTGLGMLSVVQGHPDILAAMEDSLASQLVIVPFLYYPVILALTGMIQVLSPRSKPYNALEKIAFHS